MVKNMTKQLLLKNCAILMAALLLNQAQPAYAGGLFSRMCPGFRFFNRTGETIYVNTGSAYVPAGTSERAALRRGYKKIAHGHSACFVTGQLFVGGLIWLNYENPEKNGLLGSPRVFDTWDSTVPVGDEIHACAKLEDIFDLQAIVATKTTDLKPKTQLVLVGKHKLTSAKTVYILSSSPRAQRDRSGTVSVTPGVARRPMGAGERNGVQFLLDELDIFE